LNLIFSDIEMNEDYFVDQEIGPMTEGRYKSDSRRDSKKDNKNSAQQIQLHMIVPLLY
jgi:hypothetical protein